VQNYFGVRCDPSLPYDPAFQPPSKPPTPPIGVSRPNFVQLCGLLTGEDEQAFEAVWRMLGLSVDWTQSYRTIDEHSRRVSQRAFLRNLSRGEAYAREAPVLWDIDFQTAVAQAELEDREGTGTYFRLSFYQTDLTPVYVETTRPELVCSCVALVAHPDDDRYRPLVGSTVRTPVFDVEVPVVAHQLADPEKGSGLAMICTFGDTTDVIWWRDLNLETRAVLQRDGKFQEATPAWLTGPASAAYSRLAGLTVKAARRTMVELLTEAAALSGEPRPVNHNVKYYEKGERPLEIVTSRQWYIRNGGRDQELADQLLTRGKELRWVPEHMRARFEHWVNGLAGDWLISRQRFFGVPFPVWYPIDAAGVVRHENPIVPSEADLPVDPSVQPPPRFEEAQRGRPGGFVGDADIMDTWATSSLSPQIAGWWVDDPDLFERVFPMDLRPQGHDIIRTWLFSTVTRAHLEHDSLPWLNAAISGWVLDPNRKKMSKSIGNVVTPLPLLQQYGSDAVRYWAASGRPGTDTSIDEGQIKVGRRLAIKILNASRFVLNLNEDAPGDVSEPIDRSLLHSLAGLVERATAALEDFDYSRALDETERAFWEWCDDYLELVKSRAYRSGAEAMSAQRALQMGLSVFLRLFAPFLPFVTEEVWSWWKEGSIHRASWPTPEEMTPAANEGVLAAVAAVLAEVRRAKSEAKVSMKAEVGRLVVSADAGQVELIRLGQSDLKEAASVNIVELSEGEWSVSVELA
jgi:valyl-tRNA synthetase